MNPLLAVLGILMLLPGLCGTYFLGLTFSEGYASTEANIYMAMFLAVAVPSIQIGCHGLWLLARDSDKGWLRSLTRAAGWFGAFAAAVLIIRFVMIGLKEGGAESLMLTSLAGFVIAVVPFLLGGLKAIRIDRGRGGAK